MADTTSGEPPPEGTPLSAHGQTGVMGDVLGLMVEAEARHHSIGWDGSPPTLYHVCSDRTRYQLAMCPLDDREALTALAAGLECSVPDPIAWVLYPGRPLAHFVVTEAWGHDTSMIDFDEWVRQRAGRKLADMVGSYEMRIALALVGHPARCLQLVRRRGAEPLLWPEPDKTTGDPGGMFDSLSRLHEAAGRIHRTRGRRPKMSGRA
jgi:hypothetical protein